MFLGYSSLLPSPQSRNIGANPPTLQFQGTWIQIRNSNIPDRGATLLLEQLQDTGSLGRQGITYAIDRDGDRLMIYDNNRTQKVSVDRYLKGKGLSQFFRYTKQNVEPTENISSHEAMRAYETLQAVIADRSNIDVETALKAMVVLQRAPHFEVLGLTTDSQTGKLTATNVLEWLQGADAEQRLRQFRAHQN